MARPQPELKRYAVEYEDGDIVAMQCEDPVPMVEKSTRPIKRIAEISEEEAQAISASKRVSAPVASAPPERGPAPAQPVSSAAPAGADATAKISDIALAIANAIDQVNERLTGLEEAVTDHGAKIDFITEHGLGRDSSLKETD